MLEEVKKVLRITHTMLDSEITSEIESCKKDLSIGGVTVTDETDALTARAIKLYCQAAHDFNGKGEKYSQAYEKLKIAMALTGDYNEVTPSV